MAQTTESLSFADCGVDVRGTNTDWTDIGSVANAVTVSGSPRAVGSAVTFQGDVPIVTGGKRDAFDVTVRLLYTENTGEGAQLVRAQHANGPFYVRWRPSGDQAESVAEYQTVRSVLSDYMEPSGEAGDPDPITIEFTVRCPQVDKNIVSFLTQQNDATLLAQDDTVLRSV